MKFDDIIGQDELIVAIQSMLAEKRYPRCSIIAGDKGSGKHILASAIADSLSKNIMELPDVKIDTLRYMITTSYKQVETTVFIIPNCDTMSISAKNSLLKVIEEPPNNAYFIMLVNNLSNVLNTIKSRATIFEMQIYTPDDIDKYITKKKYALSQDEIKCAHHICLNLSEVDYLVKIGVREFYNFMETVFLRINNPESSALLDSLSILNRLQLKSDDDNKYDLTFFLNAYLCFAIDNSFIVCMNNAGDKDENERIYNCMMEEIKITNAYIRLLSNNSLNRKMIADSWVFDIRRLINSYEVKL